MHDDNMPENVSPIFENFRDPRCIYADLVEETRRLIALSTSEKK